MSYKSKITENDAKKHLHELRYQRQKQIASIIDQCDQLSRQHKDIFDNQFNSSPATKKVLSVKDEALNPQIDLEYESPSTRGLAEYISESSGLFLDNQLLNYRILSSDESSRQSRCFSVSTISSDDRRTNQVYETWPDYKEINQIVGYRIIKSPRIPSSPPPPVVETNPKKIKKCLRFVDAVKQVQHMSTAEQNVLKNAPIEDSPIVEKLPINNSALLSSEVIPPELPSFFCPTSKYYSKRIQTRQWLMKNVCSPQTHPLI